MASRTHTTRASGTMSFERGHARDGHEDEQDLLRRVGGRRDRVGGEHRERDLLGEPLVVLFAAGDRNPDHESLQGPPHGSSSCQTLEEGRSRRSVPRMTPRCRKPQPDKGRNSCTWSWWDAGGSARRSRPGFIDAGHSVAIIDKRPEAFDRLRHRASPARRSPASGSTETVSRRPASRRPPPSQRSPTATTRTS